MSTPSRARSSRSPLSCTKNKHAVEGFGHLKTISKRQLNTFTHSDRRLTESDRKKNVREKMICRDGAFLSSAGKSKGALHYGVTLWCKKAVCVQLRSSIRAQMHRIPSALSNGIVPLLDCDSDPIAQHDEAILLRLSRVHLRGCRLTLTLLEEFLLQVGVQPPAIIDGLLADSYNSNQSPSTCQKYIQLHTHVCKACCT